MFRIERCLRVAERKSLAGTCQITSTAYQQVLQACVQLHLLVLHKVPRELCVSFVVEQSSQTHIMAAVRATAAIRLVEIERSIQGSDLLEKVPHIPLVPAIV